MAGYDKMMYDNLRCKTGRYMNTNRVPRIYFLTNASLTRESKSINAKPFLQINF